MTVVRRVAKAMAAVTSQRKAVEAYCKERYGGFSDESGGACPKSKVRFLGIPRKCSAFCRKRRFLKSVEHNYICVIFNLNFCNNLI